MCVCGGRHGRRYLTKVRWQRDTVAGVGCHCSNLIRPKQWFPSVMLSWASQYIYVRSAYGALWHVERAQLCRLREVYVTVS
jgi:hypothetical protein